MLCKSLTYCVQSRKSPQTSVNREKQRSEAGKGAEGSFESPGKTGQWPHWRCVEAVYWSFKGQQIKFKNLSLRLN